MLFLEIKTCSCKCFCLVALLSIFGVTTCCNNRRFSSIEGSLAHILTEREKIQKGSCCTDAQPTHRHSYNTELIRIAITWNLLRSLSYFITPLLISKIEKISLLTYPLSLSSVTDAIPKSGSFIGTLVRFEQMG